MFVRVKKFDIESKSNKGLKKGYMHVVITFESTTIVLLIVGFQPKLVPIFFHTNFIKEFKSFIQSWNSTTIVVIIIGVKGKGDNRMKKIDDCRWRGKI
jgi:hypothetical protein